MFISLFACVLDAQVIRPLRPFTSKGTVKQVSRGSVVMNDKSGRTWQLYYSGSDGVVVLGKKGKFAAPKPVVEVTGSLGIADMKKDMAVQFDCYVSDKGRVRKPVSEIKWIEASSLKPGTKLDRKKTNDQNETLCRVTGTIDRVDKNGFMVRVPRSRLAAKGSMAIPLEKDTKLLVKTRDLSKAREGDVISEVTGVELNTGDYVVQKLVVRLVPKSSSDDAKPSKSKTASASRALLDAKYENLSDEPVEAARLIRTPYLLLTSDLSDRRARMLLDETQELLGVLSQYYRKKPTAPLECNVIDDVAKWQASELPKEVTEALAQKKSTLVPKSGGTNKKSKKVAIYAPRDVRKLRADVVRAFCYQAFGGLGPDWYSQGMCEVGKRWKEPINEVDIDSNILRVLRRAKEPKPLREVIAKKSDEPQEEPTATEPLTNAQKNKRAQEKIRSEREVTAYRWALCYMLSHNPNYRKKFVELGTGLMSERETSLGKTFGKVAKQLQFEFDQFTQDVDNGYRMDLCAWRWKHRFKELEKASSQKFDIQSKLGWQPTVLVKKGVRYEIITKGQWKIDGSGTTTNADGDEKGRGKLVAAVMDEYRLSKPIPIGESSTFQAPTDGKLYLRCDEKWGALADNSGKITALLRHPKKQ